MKNLKSILTNSFSIIIGILIYSFLSQNYFSYSANLTYSTTEGSKTGYQLIRQLFEGGDGNVASTIMVVALFIISILAGLMIICSIYNLLKSANVIKVENEKVNKAFNITNMVLGIVIGVLSIVVISCTAGYLNYGLNVSIATSDAETFSAMGMPVTVETVLSNLMTELNTTIGWANITNIVLGLILIVPTTLSFVFDRK